MSDQWTGPGVREAAQFVLANVEGTQGFQPVHEALREGAQTIVREVQLLQLTEADPVGTCKPGTSMFRRGGRESS